MNKKVGWNLKFLFLAKLLKKFKAYLNESCGIASCCSVAEVDLG
jgi:hypothetical protein